MSAAGITTIDGHLLRKMVIAGANALMRDKRRIDALNVFPVPDGDTGTNMSLTVLSAAKEVEKQNSSSASAVAKAAASGSLRGARGNSGVILSQLFRGFAKGCEGLDEIAIADLIKALESSAATAYKAVMKPKEGTMLTVARHMAEFAATYPKNQKSAPSNIEGFGKAVLRAGDDILAKTPDMLPVLKQAGVVDAGGEGLLVFMRGALASLHEETQPVMSGNEQADEPADFAALTDLPHGEITFGYCTEFFIIAGDFNETKEDEFKAYLDTMGDSVVVVSDDAIVKVHVHTDHPGAVMERAMNYGQLDGVKIENMWQQNEAFVAAQAGATPALTPALSAAEEEKEVGFVAVCAGEGFKAIFQELGVDYIIEGGQTMNPSAQDIADAIGKVKAPVVIVLPNNKNIILAAQQAVHLCESKKVMVVDTESIPQGITAMINSYAATPEAAHELMQASLATVTTGQITHAVRDTQLDGVDIHEGDYICLLNGKIINACQSLHEAATGLIDAMIVNGDEVIGVFPGADAPNGATQHLMDYIYDNYPDCEADGREGGQPIYYFIFSAE